MEREIFLEIGKEYEEISFSLKRETIAYLKKVCEENGGRFSIEDADLDIVVTYDGGRHPEWNSNAFSQVYDVHLDEEGNVELAVDEDEHYETYRICDVGELYSIAYHIHSYLEHIATPSKLRETLQKEYDEYKQKHIFAPTYANVFIKWCDDDMEDSEFSLATIKLNTDVVVDEDDVITFYCDGIDELKKLTNPYNKEDFVVVGFDCFTDKL